MDKRVKQLLEKHKEDKDLTSEKDYIEPGWDWSETDLSGWNLSGLLLSDCDNDKETNFQKATLDSTNFRKAILIGANFKDSFISSADFREAELRYADFRKIRTWDVIDFQKASLTRADFQGSDISEADFRDAHIWGVNFQGTNLVGADLRGADFNNGTNLKDSYLLHCRFENSTLRAALNNIDKICMEERDSKYEEAKEVYRNLKNYFRQEGLYDESGMYYYREKLMEKQLHRQDKRWSKWIGNNIYHYLAGYGEHPLRVLWWWIIIIFFFGTIYWATDGITRSGNPVQWYENYYFSVVTFTTLGFGDIQPHAEMWPIQLCAMIEALLGAILMALFILTFGRKMMR